LTPAIAPLKTVPAVTVHPISPYKIYATDNRYLPTVSFPPTPILPRALDYNSLSTLPLLKKTLPPCAEIQQPPLSSAGGSPMVSTATTDDATNQATAAVHLLFEEVTVRRSASSTRATPTPTTSVLLTTFLTKTDPTDVSHP
jgi:hypothetical protein